MVTKEQLKSLNSRKEELYRCLDISKKKEDANNLEETTQSENFWKCLIISLDFENIAFFDSEAIFEPITAPGKSFFT